MPLTPESLHDDVKEIKQQLCDIQRMVSKIAVQDERIKHIEISVEALWNKHDRRAEQIEAINRHQASCPREQVKWVWWVLVPQSLALLGMLLAVLHKMGVGK